MMNSIFLLLAFVCFVFGASKNENTLTLMVESIYGQDLRIFTQPLVKSSWIIIGESKIHMDNLEIHLLLVQTNQISHRIHRAKPCDFKIEKFVTLDGLVSTLPVAPIEENLKLTALPYNFYAKHFEILKMTLFYELTDCYEALTEWQENDLVILIDMPESKEFVESMSKRGIRVLFAIDKVIHRRRIAVFSKHPADHARVLYLLMNQKLSNPGCNGNVLKMFTFIQNWMQHVDILPSSLMRTWLETYCHAGGGGLIVDAFVDAKAVQGYENVLAVARDAKDVLHLQFNATNVKCPYFMVNGYCKLPLATPVAESVNRLIELNGWNSLCFITTEDSELHSIVISSIVPIRVLLIQQQ